MARRKGSISPESSRFSDAYDLYVDYGKGKPIKMNDDEATFIDIEKFLIGKNYQSNMINNKISNKVKGINISKESKSIIRNSYAHASITNNEQTLIDKYIHHSSSCQNRPENIESSFTPNRPDRGSSSSQIESKIIYDETWFSNKQHNTRVAAFIDQMHDKFNDKNEQKSSRTSTHQKSQGQMIYERVYPVRTEAKLGLRVAVNGASKSMSGQLPLSNLNLSNGDFGDDAGMIFENQNFYFVGLADGAGGNRSLGINPAHFPQAVLAACRNSLRQNNLQSYPLPELIISAMQQVETTHIRGSSTVCLLTLNKQEHTLTSLNIGDSGFVICRNNEIYHRSTCTVTTDGCGPRQLFAIDGSFELPCFSNKNEVLEDCSLDTVKVQKSDIIILSSDGLWDVIKADKLKQIIERNANNHLQDLADDLLKEAVNGYYINNRDDILIIVCQVDEL